MNLRVCDIAAADLVQRLRLTQFSVDHAADTILWITSDFRLIYVNEQAARSLGYAREELVTMRLADIDPRFTDEICREYWGELEARRNLEFESIHRRRDGVEIPVWVRATHYRYEDFELAFLYCRDITEIKAIESALRQANEDLELRVLQRTAELGASEARYHDLYHNAPDMFASVEAKNGCIVQCNQTLARAMGRPVEDLIGRHFVELFDPASRAQAESLWKEFLAAGDVRVRVLPLHAALEKQLVSVNMTAIRGESGDILFARSTMRDVTEMRKAAQQAEQHRSELTDVARLATTGEMAAGLAHELNQPLYAMNNFAQGAIRRLEAGSLDREMLLGVLHDIAHESQRAAEIIRSLRRYIGQRAPRRIAVDLNGSIRQVVGLLAVEADRRQVAVEMRLTEPLPQVQCDAIQVEQVLINLILNGMEAMTEIPPNQRKICISSSLINERLVQLAVTDNGQGLASTDIERIFDAFYTTKAEGLGLGLAISRTIVEAHGGQLVVAANHDRGVTASFALSTLTHRS